ncbi:MAG: 4'-phosphopantetheinyl transferase superfamily protein [Chitinophaga sp.]|uniref:4'-phosphopantetheinyl transferase family protein n=1 Tax=Chitinophaga sp. TaxID=1869181 RepID=UPI001B0DF825|nr:4'-phosphopantetheinyl transferase superfamily protein [Chitinophaga sp.]MBO9730149.1 4'-phosphopantetheinyl transferase superfamily protein [Chitinophaga sp.]
MIGNDIVDLDLAEKESNIHRNRFRDKLFLPHEKTLIEKAAHPDVMLWLLWSCKEAVYKIIHRITHERKFAPQQFACYLSPNTEAAGEVVYQQQHYYFQSRRVGSGIHTMAAVSRTLLDQVTIQTAYHVKPGWQHLLPATELFQKDEHGIPYVRDSYSGARWPVSVSHHGKYAGMVKMCLPSPQNIIISPL